MLVNAKCPECGSKIQVPDSDKKCTCSACGEEIETKKAIAGYDEGESSSTTKAPEQRDPAPLHSIPRCIGVGFLCAMSYGFTCGIFTIFFATNTTGLSLIENLLGWVVGIAAGVLYRKDDEANVPFLTFFASWIGLLIGWVHGLIAIVIDWEHMGSISVYMKELSEQASGLEDLIYTLISSWSGALAGLQAGESILNNGALLLVFLGMHVIAASFAAVIIPCGVSYICDRFSKNPFFS